MHNLIMYFGFLFAAYSVVANDVIQTLGTFLTSNAKRKWWILWGYAGILLTTVVIVGWFLNNGDVSYGRLNNIPFPENFYWWYILPPIILLIVTQFGLPVSTTFMILSVFSSKQVIEKMVLKSITGYGVAFITAFLIYLLIAKKFETKDATSKALAKKQHMFWISAQWLSTGFLWVQWLIQDFANIYVYLPRQLNLTTLLISLGVILSLLAFVFQRKGGKIQEVVRQKTNSAHIRSATLIDLSYGIVLFFFTTINPIPMSTTWTFVGILAGREFAISYLLEKHKIKETYKKIYSDLAKVNAGLIISILLALLIKTLK